MGGAQNTNKSGFSLIELLVAITVVGILSAIALPSYRSWIDSAKYKEAARRVASLLRQGRSEAVAKNRECQAKFNFETDRYSLARGNLSSGSTTFVDMAVSESGFSAGVEIRGESDCSVNLGEETLQFNPNGSSDTLDICIMDDAGNKKYLVGVTVANTGRVVIQTWDSGSGTWK